MFAIEPSLNPPCDEWIDYELPQLCQHKIAEVCHDILERGENTIYAAIYDAIYELVEAQIENQYLNWRE